MSRLALLAEEYLQTRRALGYKLTSQGRILAGFVRSSTTPVRRASPSRPP